MTEKQQQRNEPTEFEQLEAKVVSLETANLRNSILLNALAATHPDFAALQRSVLYQVEKRLKRWSPEEEARMRAAAPDFYDAMQEGRTYVEKMADESDRRMLESLRGEYS